MKRYILNDLEAWKTSKRRKPLILRGARQVGKTWILKEFGKTYKNGYIYINLDQEENYVQLFESTKDIDRLVDMISMASGHQITTDTLLIIDEIQTSGAALNCLKYFCENRPEYHVAAAGSLLGLHLSDGFPVGKVNFLEMYPMTFSEFLMACGDDNLLAYMDSISEIAPIPDVFGKPLMEKLKMYYVVGGMPEAVKEWSEEKNSNEVDTILDEILLSYEHDFGKHTDSFEAPKLKLIWDSIPSQLARENKKFLYSVVKEGARAREYENALNWIVNADILNKIYAISKPGLPITAYDDLSAFKIYMNDVGLLRRKSRLSTSAVIEEDRLFTEFKGALTENYILQSLLTNLDMTPRYWKDTKNEVDFIIQIENDILPIEVKAGNSVKKNSIKKYEEKYSDNTKYMIRFSQKNLSFDGKLLNVPLFLADHLLQLVKCL
ncbi:MAG: ATP-binding protein [Lachnospiraceae bacterium]|nr:ATP-binding protein [Lachnospiraceae bacterium]